MRIHEVYISHDSETVQVQKCAQVLKGVTLSPDSKTPKHNAYSAALLLHNDTMFTSFFIESVKLWNSLSIENYLKPFPVTDYFFALLYIICLY